MFFDSSITPRAGVEHSSGACEQFLFWTGLNERLCVQHVRSDTDLDYQPHSHSEYTILICLEGKVSKSQLGQTQTIGGGEGMISNFGVEHSCRYLVGAGKKCELVSVSLDPPLLMKLAADFDLPMLKKTSGPAFWDKVSSMALADCARAIAAEMRDQPRGHQTIIESQAIRLVVETMRAWPRCNITDMELDSTPRLPRREFIRAYEFMRCCRKENFRLQHLCRYLGSSEERFTRLFQASTKQTPGSFYNQLLLERAETLLRGSNLAVKEIAFELGFKTSSHFIAAFGREHSMSPQEYREMARLTLLSSPKTTD